MIHVASRYKYLGTCNIGDVKIDTCGQLDTSFSIRVLSRPEPGKIEKSHALRHSYRLSIYIYIYMYP